MSLKWPQIKRFLQKMLQETEHWKSQEERLSREVINKTGCLATQLYFIFHFKVVFEFSECVRNNISAVEFWHLYCESPKYDCQLAIKVDGSGFHELTLSNCLTWYIAWLSVEHLVFLAMSTMNSPCSPSNLSVSPSHISMVSTFHIDDIKATFQRSLTPWLMQDTYNITKPLT